MSWPLGAAPPLRGIGASQRVGSASAQDLRYLLMEIRQHVAADKFTDRRK